MRKVKNIIILLLIISYIIAYKLFVFDNFMKYSGLISTYFFALILIISIRFLGIRKCKSTYLSQNIFRITIFLILMNFIITYGLGFVTGFLKNSYSLKPITILENIFSPILIIIFEELFRYVFIWANKDKRIFIILVTLTLILFEIALNVRTLNVNSIELLFNITAGKIIPIAIKNIVLSYICFHTGFKIPLFYRLIMDIYIYIFPIFPDLGDYINSLVLIVLPFAIYYFSSNIVYEKIEKISYEFVKSNFYWSEIPFAIVLIIVICLVSGFFPVYMIGIKSNSMQPNIDRGDAVIISKINEKSTLKRGDIIAYKRDKIIIVHRIQNITKADGKKVYITKGDANKTNDDGIVTIDQIEGIIKFKIKYIAYPSVWLSELIKE